MVLEHTIYIGCDHAGFSLKKLVMELLAKEFATWKVVDCGCPSEESADYPVSAKAVGEQVVRNGGLGILICGSGIGIAIAANKVKGVRAANVADQTAARLSRSHNNANVVSFGARLTGPEVAFDIVRAFLKTEFEGGRHERRVRMIHDLEGSGK